MENLLSTMQESWPTPFVRRVDLAKFSGGVIGSKVAANLDVTNSGIQNRFQFGKFVCYPVESVIEYLGSILKMEEK